MRILSSCFLSCCQKCELIRTLDSILPIRYIVPIGEQFVYYTERQNSCKKGGQTYILPWSSLEMHASQGMMHIFQRVLQLYTDPILSRLAFVFLHWKRKDARQGDQL